MSLIYIERPLEDIICDRINAGVQLYHENLDSGWRVNSNVGFELPKKENSMQNSAKVNSNVQNSNVRNPNGQNLNVNPNQNSNVRNLNANPNGQNLNGQNSNVQNSNVRNPNGQNLNVQNSNVRNSNANPSQTSNVQNSNANPSQTSNVRNSNANPSQTSNVQKPNVQTPNANQSQNPLFDFKFDPNWPSCTMHVMIIAEKMKQIEKQLQIVRQIYCRWLTQTMEKTNYSKTIVDEWHSKLKTLESLAHVYELGKEDYIYQGILHYSKEFYTLLQ